MCNAFDGGEGPPGSKVDEDAPIMLLYEAHRFDFCLVLRTNAFIRRLQQLDTWPQQSPKARYCIITKNKFLDALYR
jgi:hypothetical protein